MTFPLFVLCSVQILTRLSCHFGVYLSFSFRSPPLGTEQQTFQLVDDLLQLQSHSHPPVCIFLQFNTIICSISALSLNALCFLLASDYTNLTCFQTASHPGRKMFGFIFHLKYIILMFSFQINIYLQDM